MKSIGKIKNWLKKLTSNRTIKKYKVFTSSSEFGKWQKNNPKCKVIDVNAIMLSAMQPTRDDIVSTSTYIYGIQVLYSEPFK